MAYEQLTPTTTRLLEPAGGSSIIPCLDSILDIGMLTHEAR
jgi:hypothetical protein